MSVNEDKLTSAVTGAPATWGSQCCEVILASGADSFASADISALPTGFLRYEVILGVEGLADNEERMLFWFSGSGGVGQDLMLVYLRQVAGGELRWRFRVFESSLVSPTIYTTTTGLALNTPYRLEFKWDTTGDVWEIRQNNTTLFSGTLTSTPATTQLAGLGIGSWELNTGTATYYLDNIAVADDDWIGAEAGAAPTYDVAGLVAANRIAIASM